MKWTYRFDLVALFLAIATMMSACSPPKEEVPSASTELEVFSIETEHIGTDEPAKLSADSGSDAGQTPEPDAFIPMNLDLEAETYEYQGRILIPPDDVLRELAYSGGAGGAGDPCYEFTEREPSLVADEPLNAQWNTRVLIESCGWSSGEQIHFVVTSPSGGTFSDGSFVTREEGSGYPIIIEFPLNSAPGEYRVTATGDSNVAELVVSVETPREAMLYWFPSDRELFLYNFMPNEQIRLLIYGWQEEIDYSVDSVIYRLIDVAQYRVDELGQLKILVDDFEFDNQIYELKFAVLGETSGEVPEASGFPELSFGEVSFKRNTRLQAHIPTESENASAESIWSRIPFEDLLSPGKVEYELIVTPSEAIVWDYYWCAEDGGLLYQITTPLTLKFRVDGVPLADNQIGESSVKSSRGWQCRQWSTYIPEWPPGFELDLEIHFSLAEDVFDGARTYPAGEYRHLINVEVGN